jgi:hypothetical protein
VVTATQKRIAVVQGAPSPVVQDLLRRFVAGLSRHVRLAGVIDDPMVGDAEGCSAGDLRSLADGLRFPMLQDLGPGAAACRLDAEGVVSACAAVERGIDAGCDLVVLNKFGKLEANGSGLAPAFARAVGAGCSVLTSVAPKLNDAWDRFAAPFYVLLPPDPAAIASWWLEIQPQSVGRAEAAAP